MFADEKPKRKENVFQSELLDGEEILWMGQGDKWKLFVGADLFMIPFSLFWCGFVAMFWMNGFPNLFILPHTLIGLYMLFGRFFVKFWRKQHTYYAVTNHRLMILSQSFGQHLLTYDVSKLPSLRKSIGMNGVGSIIFGVEPEYRWWQRKQYNMSNTGSEMFGYSLPGFYYIHDADEVYRMIAQMAHQTSYAFVEKAKPSYLPR